MTKNWREELMKKVFFNFFSKIYKILDEIIFIHFQVLSLK